MLEIKEMLPQDEAAVLPMVNGFYHSDAVDHQVDEKILRKTFLDAVSGDCPALRGVTLWEGEKMVGFAYLTTFYACEVGGRDLSGRLLPGKGIRNRIFPVDVPGVSRGRPLPPGSDGR